MRRKQQQQQQGVQQQQNSSTAGKAKKPFLASRQQQRVTQHKQQGNNDGKWLRLEWRPCHYKHDTESGNAMVFSVCTGSSEQYDLYVNKQYEKLIAKWAICWGTIATHDGFFFLPIAVWEKERMTDDGQKIKYYVRRFAPNYLQKFMKQYNEIVGHYCSQIEGNEEEVGGGTTVKNSEEIPY